MRTSKCGIGCAGLLVGVSLLAFSLPAGASTYTTADTYWGGYNTYHNYPPPSTAADTIADNDHFDIYGTTLTRTGNNLSVSIFTNFVQHVGEDGVGLGALFIKDGTPNYNTLAPNYTGQISGGPPTYAYDLPSADPTRFDYAVQLPNALYAPPSSTNGVNKTGVSGTDGALYHLNGTGTDVAPSNVDGNPITAPIGGNPGFYFRAGQDVGVNPTTAPLANVSYSIGSGSFTDNSGTHSTGTLNFDLTNFFGTVVGDTNTFTIAWAMTCANDVIYATTQLGASSTTTPLPASLPLFIGGLGLVGFISRKRRKLRSLASA